MRIGTLARRVGVAPDTLRAWERRYGVPSPGRTGGGYRLYGPAEEARLRRMLGHMAAGVAPAEAAELVRSDEVPPPSEDVSLSDELLGACISFDSARAHAVIDAALARVPLRELVEDVLLACLREVGSRWSAGTGSIAEEHFASALIRERLLALGRDWDAGSGPRALLACPTGERHDIGLIAAGVWLGHLGWRVTFLGSDTPVESIEHAARSLHPAAVVLSVTAAEIELRRAPRVDAPIHLVGPAAERQALAGSTVHHRGPIEAATAIDLAWRSMVDAPARAANVNP